MPKETVRTYAIPTQEDNEAEGIIRASYIVIDSEPGTQAERIVIRDLGDRYGVHRQLISHAHAPCFIGGFYFSKSILEEDALKAAHNCFEHGTKRLGARI